MPVWTRALSAVGSAPSSAAWTVCDPRKPTGTSAGLWRRCAGCWTGPGSSSRREGRDALPVLEAITDEYAEAWEWLDDSNGEVGDFFYELGEAWTEALLSAKLTRAEREGWSAKLEAWREELKTYAGGEAFYVALLAAERGWDHQTLARVLAEPGELTEPGAALEQDDCDLLTVARLNVLERQGRCEEYLRLADYAGEVCRRAVMLVRMGRTEEAVGYALERLRVPEEALTVAGALREREEVDGALRVGEHGLSLEGRKAALAVRVRELASGMGRPGPALRAAVIAFRKTPPSPLTCGCESWPARVGRNTARGCSITCVGTSRGIGRATWRSSCTKGCWETPSPRSKRARSKPSSNGWPRRPSSPTPGGSSALAAGGRGKSWMGEGLGTTRRPLRGWRGQGPLTGPPVGRASGEVPRGAHRTPRAQVQAAAHAGEPGERRSVTAADRQRNRAAQPCAASRRERVANGPTGEAFDRGRRPSEAGISCGP